MPISSTIDYIPVMDEFLTHWRDLPDSAILASESGPVGYTTFESLRMELDAAKTGLQRKLNSLENARVNLDRARVTAGDRVAEFNRRIRAEFPTNAEFNRLPTVPNRTAGRDAFLDAMDDAIDLWERVDALPPTPVFTAPLRLIGGLSKEEFSAMRRALDSAFTLRGNCEAAAYSQRLSRNSLQTRAKSIMVLYRLKVEALYAPDSQQVATLPRLTPLPGSTPAAVTLKAEWNATDLQAELTWTASDDPDLASYQVRGVPGPDYSSEDETLLATLPPDAPRVWRSASGLALPGTAMSYKIYVRLASGHESGSEARTLTRPG